LNRVGLGQPSPGLENFPQKKLIFSVFSLWGQKKYLQVGSKISGSELGPFIQFTAG